MAEGGINPWKLNSRRIDPGSPDLDSYGKPLPSPPLGFFWECQEDKSWLLNKFDTKLSSSDDCTKFECPTVLEHIVLPEDTLTGLTLRYKISSLDLRRYNNFSGNNIQYHKTLRIPVAPGVPINIQEQDSHQVRIVKFRNLTNEGAIEAELYLSESEEDLDKAIAAWKTDNESMQTVDTKNLSKKLSDRLPPAPLSPKSKAPLSTYAPPQLNVFNCCSASQEEQQDEKPPASNGIELVVPAAVVTSGEVAPIAVVAPVAVA